ncbi:MAG: efflux transporter outer membrane subunit, partial [Nevskiales bacterium]
MKTFRLTAMALGLSLLLAGCITPPKDAVREQQPLDAAVLGTVAVSAPTAADDWWNAYQDPQLDRLMQQALAGNPSLAQALARVREAQSYADTTRASLSPAVSYDASETRQRFSGKDVIPPPYAGSVQWEGSQGLNLSWDLDFWGRQSSLLQQAQAQTAASGLDAAGARLAVAGAVSRAYIELDRNYALADLARRSEAQRQQILGITRSRVKAGLDTNVELREAEGAVPQAHVDLLQAESDQARSVHLLAALSGQGAGAYAGIERPTLQHEAVLNLPQTLPADLLGRRPDLLAARSRVEAASAGQAAAKAAFYPDINLVAFAGTSA